ncbi:MAG: hypothetical protein MUC91_06775 [Verrucomicrobia bacterium]|nr:hypothetical protein [Verrucomicrobiota bacterium]
MMTTIRPLLTASLLALASLVGTPCLLPADIPPAEQILPRDTIAMATVPDWQSMCKAQAQSPQLQLWKDPQMKLFREHFLKQWSEEVVQPLERELGLRFKDYQGLLQGQLTLALIKNDWDTGTNQVPGMVILLDAGDHQDQLKTNLTQLRRQWVEKGKPIRTETVRGVEFSIVQLSTNDLPDTLRKFMPGTSDVEELTGEDAPEPKPRELFIGQSDSLLILVDSLPAAQKIMTRLTGGSLPPLADVDQFVQDQGRLFRTAHAYGWVNASVLLGIIENNLTAQAENRDENAPDPLAQIKPARVIAATGLSGVHSAAFAYTETPGGSEIALFMGVPESERRGIFKILAGEPKDTLPPPFVPEEVVQYQRWRLDGSKTYSALEQMLQDISPQMLNGWNFVLNTANQAAKEKDPSFDLRQHLMGNLGDDMITYKKAPRSSALADLENQPTLFLLGVKNGDQVIGALKMVMGMFSRGNPPTTREFLGTTIHSFELPNPAMEYDPQATPRKLSLAVSRGYVAVTSDDAILEEFLRSADHPVKPLRQLPGLLQSAESVTGPGNSLLSFENQREAMRLQLQVLRQTATNSTPELQAPMTPITESLGVGMPRTGLTEWFDFSLLPPFDQIAKYFYHTVYGGGGSVEGLTLKIFSPTPPELKVRGADPETPPSAPSDN